MKIKDFPAFWVLSVLLLLVYAVNANAGDPSSDAFNVMSFNVSVANPNDGDNIWENRRETLVEVVRDSDPILLGVQESLLRQTRDIEAALDGYKWIGVGRDDGQEKGEFMAIFYKESELELLDSGTLWLSETPEKPGKGWDAECFRTVTWAKFRARKTNKTFVYMNTHFDHIGKVARQNSAELLLRRSWELTNHGALPVFISGDFNVSRSSNVYRTLVEGIDDVPGLFDSNDIAKEHDIAQPYTFHAFGEVAPEDGSIIDFIFVNDKVDVAKFKIDPVKHRNGRYASDHVSIVATLSLK